MTHGTSEPALSGGEIFAAENGRKPMSESIFRLSASEGATLLKHTQLSFYSSPPTFPVDSFLAKALREKGAFVLSQAIEPWRSWFISMSMHGGEVERFAD